MRTTRKHIPPLLAAVAVVTAIAQAPVAAAADTPVATDQPSPPSQSCAQLGAADNTNANHPATLS